MGKIIRTKSITCNDTNTSLNEIDKWDSKYAFFVSSSIIELLLVIRNTLSKYKPCPGNQLLKREEIKEVFEASLQLEQALRHEVGIYSSSGFHNAPIQNRFLHSYIYEPSQNETIEKDDL